MLLAAAGSEGPKPETQIFPDPAVSISPRCRVAPFILTNATIRPKTKLIPLLYRILKAMAPKDVYTNSWHGRSVSHLCKGCAQTLGAPRPPQEQGAYDLGQRECMALETAHSQRRADLGPHILGPSVLATAYGARPNGCEFLNSSRQLGLERTFPNERVGSFLNRRVNIRRRLRKGAYPTTRCRIDIGKAHTTPGYVTLIHAHVAGFPLRTKSCSPSRST